MRVLLAPIETAGVAGALARALRRRGHDAELAVFVPHPFGYPHDRTVGTGYARRAAAGLGAPLRHDVLHWQFGTTLLEFVDAAWARPFRRTQVMHYWGDDVRTREVTARLHPGRARAFDAMARDDRTVRRRLRLAGRLCAAALVSDLELAAHARPWFRAVYVLPTPLELPLDVGPAPPPLAGEEPIVLHAPSDAAIKGTREIGAALEAVAARRPLRPRLVRGVARPDVLAEVARADVVVDQLNSDTPGVFALEAMALSVPVLVEYDPAMLAPFARAAPLVRVSPATLEAELERLLDDGERRGRLGAAGAAYVAGVHDADRVAVALEHVYAHAAGRPRGLFEAGPEGVRQLRSPLP
ncbi:MAG: hypothetical protein WD844_11015 [Thermoleophilaceae bacterium]